MKKIDTYGPEDFESALREITCRGRYFFLEDHLYYHFCRERISAFNEFKSVFRWVKPGGPDRDVFRNAFREFARMEKEHPLLALLVDPEAEMEIRGRSETDLREYGFDFLIVVDHSAMARMLLANNFHFHTRSAIVSRDGFPESLFEHFRETARKNPDIPIIGLHNLSLAGLDLLNFIRRTWFFGDTQERILLRAGLRPRDYLRNRSRMHTYDPAPDDPEETAADGWLYSAELAGRERRLLQEGVRVELTNLAPRELMDLLWRYMRRRMSERSVFFAEQEAGAEPSA